MEKKKKDILIHPDRIENLEKTRQRLEKNRRKPKKTGYVTTCHLRNSRRHRDLLLPTRFVQEKLQSGCLIFFQVLGQPQMMMQPVPVKYMKRTSICHVHNRPLGRWRQYGCRVPLDAVPEPCTILHTLGLSPLLSHYTFQLEEWMIMDDAEGQVPAYKLIPLYPY